MDHPEICMSLPAILSITALKPKLRLEALLTQCLDPSAQSVARSGLMLPAPHIGSNSARQSWHFSSSNRPEIQGFQALNYTHILGKKTVEANLHVIFARGKIQKLKALSNLIFFY